MAGNTEVSSKYSPSFLKAKTPEQLEELMLITNIKDGKCYDYRDISYSNGFWFAWYFKSQEARIKVHMKNEREK